MARLLRSPFSRLIDSGIMLLTVFGRRTGRPYTFPVQYVSDGGMLWVFAGSGDEKTWWRNLVGGGPVEIQLRRAMHRGYGSACLNETDPEIVEEGLRRYAHRFPGTAKRLGFPPGDHEAFARTAARTVIVRIHLEERAPSAERELTVASG